MDPPQFMVSMTIGFWSSSVELSSQLNRSNLLESLDQIDLTRVPGCARIAQRSITALFSATYVVMVCDA